MMKIKEIVSSICLFFLFLNPALAQSTAAILPQGKTQFLDNNGNPLSSGKVYFYIPSTTTFKTTWQDSGETIANANPVILDAGGRAIIYGSGTYRQIVKDRTNNQIYDAVTASAGSGGSTTGTGDGDLVGTVKPWAGLIAPNQYVFAYGQEISRTTYDAYFIATTLNQNFNCTSGSPILTGLSDTTQLPVGAVLETTCVAAGSTVVSKTSTTVTMNNNASLTVATTGVFFLYGNGNGSTTFNVPDLRGFVVAGRNNMGGTANIFIGPSFFGGGSIGPNATGAQGGNQGNILSNSNLPPYTPTGTLSINNITATGTISTPTITMSASANSVVNSGTGGSANLTGGGGALNQAAITASSSTPVFTGTPVSSTGTFVGAAQGGISSAFSVVQPTRTLNYIIKITPDQNSTSASGVTSLGLMTGDIACGGGVVCTGNIISVLGGGLWAQSSNDIYNTNTGNVLISSATHNLAWQSGAAVDAGIDFGLTSTIKRISSDGSIALTSQAGFIDFTDAGFKTVRATQGTVSYPVTTFLNGGDTPVNNTTQFSIYHTPSLKQAQNGASAVVQTIIPNGIGGSGAAGAFIAGFQNNNDGTDAYGVLGICNNQSATVTAPTGGCLWGLARGDLGGYSGVGFIDLVRGTSEISSTGGSSLLTVTISSASPGIITGTANGYIANQQVMFSNGGSGVLPAALSFNIVYYVKTILTANTFTVSATKGGAAINTASASSGTVQIHSPQRIRAGLFINNSLYSNPVLAGAYVEGAVEYGFRVGSGNATSNVWEPTYPFAYMRKGGVQPFQVDTIGNVYSPSYYIGATTPTKFADRTGGFSAIYEPSGTRISFVTDNNNTFINGDTTLFSNRAQSLNWGQISATGLSLSAGIPFNMNGATSGGISFVIPAIAGTNTITFPALTGTVALTVGANIPTIAQGDLLYGSAANTLTTLSKDTNATRYLSNTGTSNNPAWAQINLANGVTGTVQATNFPTLTGDITTPGASLVTTLATVNSNVGTFGSATQAGQFTVNGKGLITAASNITITPAIGSITGLGTGVATFLATPSSANLATAITDETGSGALVFGTTPTIATPVINGLPTGTGVATANTVSTLVARDGSGNFSAGTITAALSGNATTATSATTATTATNATNATNSAITDDTTTNASMNLAWVTTNTGNLPLKVSSTKLQLNPSTGSIVTGVWNAGAVTSSAAVTGTTHIPTGSSAPTNGMYLPSANTVGISANSTFIGSFAATNNGVVTFNTSASTSTATPFVMDFGGTFSNSAGANPKWLLYNDGTTKYGIGLSSSQMDFIAGAGGGYGWYVTGTGNIATLTGTGLTLQGQEFMPNITQTSAAQTGTVCWTTGTGKFTVDTTVGCLTSIGAAKNILARPSAESSLNIVNALSPISFRYKNGWGDSGRYEQFGLIAEEVAKIDERLVGRDFEGTLQGVRYQELTAVLIGAIKELKKEVDNLKGK